MAEAMRVLTCAECKNPLVALAGGGSYCMHCNYIPSMQDTAIMYVCPQGHGEIEKDGDHWRCSQCDRVYTPAR